MELIRDLRALKSNIQYFENSKHSHSRDHADFVKRGTCFVAYDGSAGVAFAPSRFLGYQDNSFEAHAVNEAKNGRETNPVISEILGSEPEESEPLNALYAGYCRSLGHEANAAGNFGAPRRFWDLRK